MQAAFLVGPQKLEVRETPDPVAPDDGLVIEVKACGVCGSDLRRWREGPPPGVDGIIPGHEVAGVVIEVGKDVADYAIGDKLALSPDIHCGKCYFCRRGLLNLCDELRFLGITPGYPGGFAEKLLLTNEVLTNGIVHPMPEGLSFAHAAMAEPLCSVLASHQKTNTNMHDTVVVLGAGPIGCLLIATAKAQGAQTIVSQRSPKRRELVKAFGPDAILDPTSEDIVARVKELTGGVGADIVICANPVASTQTQAVEMARKGGTVVLFGGLPKANPMTTLDANRIHYGEVDVIGAFSYHTSVHEQALDILSRGILPIDKLITHTFPLEQVADAFETGNSGQGLKSLVVP